MWLITKEVLTNTIDEFRRTTITSNQKLTHGVRNLSCNKAYLVPFLPFYLKIMSPLMLSAQIQRPLLPVRDINSLKIQTNRNLTINLFEALKEER